MTQKALVFPSLTIGARVEERGTELFLSLKFQSQYTQYNRVME
ncbi:hypothetical protein NIES932_03060 [Raphidiopsis curvata NIES-932]|nr:hypothetical protein NIES932_03060 [Raphidiopsis curvata NIES-932]